jgi:hypothetical protein
MNNAIMNLLNCRMVYENPKVSAENPYYSGLLDLSDHAMA